MRLKNQTIIVTGASSGLGKAMANGFVSEGARVVCAALADGRLDDAVGDVSDGAGEAMGVPTDVRSWSEIQHLVKTTNDTYGPVDVLVNCAARRQGYISKAEERNPISDVPVDALDEILETNLRGVFLCSKAVLPEMLERDRGKLIHISSGAGADVGPNAGRRNKAPYAATKGGLEAFHDSLTLELKETGVQSIAFIPPRGGVHTEIKEAWGRDRSESTHHNPMVMAEPAVQLAAGRGEHGGRYEATADGDGFKPYSRFKGLVKVELCTSQQHLESNDR